MSDTKCALKRFSLCPPIERCVLDVSKTCPGVFGSLETCLTQYGLFLGFFCDCSSSKSSLLVAEIKFVVQFEEFHQI